MTYNLVLNEIAHPENRRFFRLPTAVGSTGQIFGYHDESPQETASLVGVLTGQFQESGRRNIYVTEPAGAFRVSIRYAGALVEPVGATTVSPTLRTYSTIGPPFDQLSPMAAIAVTSQWSVFCEAAFDFLADCFPCDLLRLMSSGKLGPVDLTFAAESIGRVPASDLVRRTLLPLLSHSDAIVREGAIYGLRAHENGEVRSRLTHMATADSSWEVRQVAADALTDS